MRPGLTSSWTTNWTGTIAANPPNSHGAGPVPGSKRMRHPTQRGPDLSAPCRERIEIALRKAAKPWRASKKFAHREGIERCNQAVGRECHQHLRDGHANATFGDDMRRKRREDIDPPISRRREHECTQQHDVRRPERREYLVGEGSDEKCDLASEQVGNRNNNGTQDRTLAQIEFAFGRSADFVWSSLLLALVERQARTDKQLSGEESNHRAPCQS